MRLPVIVESNAWTMPQERYNAEWVREQGVGLVLASFRRIVSGVDQVLRPTNYAGFQKAARAHQNQAIFEIPDMLANIMREAPKR